MKELMPHPWKLTILMIEDDDHCDVTIHLDAVDRSLEGKGKSRRNSGDPRVPQIGEELAVARALQDLAHHMSDDAWRMIEAFGSSTSETV